MRVESALANLDIGIGAVRRAGNNLVLQSRAGSSVEAVIVISAREVVHTLGTILSSPAGLLFVLGLPFFWLRQRLGRGVDSGASTGAAIRPVDINKPW